MLLIDPSVNTIHDALLFFLLNIWLPLLTTFIYAKTSQSALFLIQQSFLLHNAPFAYTQSTSLEQVYTKIKLCFPLGVSKKDIWPKEHVFYTLLEIGENKISFRNTTWGMHGCSNISETI